MHLDEGRQFRAQSPRRAAPTARSSDSAATISSTASAPAARASSNLILVDDEVLAEKRQATASPDRRQVREVTVEERRLGQDRDGRGARPLVRPRDRRPRRRPARSTPRDGERRLHSAMTRQLAAARQCARERQRVWPAARRRDRTGRRGLTRARADATRVRVAATIVPARPNAGVLTTRPPPRSTPPPDGPARPPRAPRLSRRARPARPSTSDRQRPGNQQRRRRVQEHDVAARTRSPASTRLAMSRVVRRIAARQVSSRGLGQADIARMQVERADEAAPALRHLRVAPRGDLVDAVRAVHDPRALDPSRASACATSSVNSGRGTPTSLVSGARRVRQRARAG